MSTPTTQTTQSQQDADPFRLGWRQVWQKDERGLMVQVRVPLTPEDLLHPQEEDFIVQDPFHDKDCRYLADVLETVLNGREGFGVFHDRRIDWEVEGVKAHGPDVALLAGLPVGWNSWVGTIRMKQVGARPVLLIEVTSRSTRDGDLDDKVIEYHRVGVPFYAIVDYRPELEHRQVDVLGYRWTADGFVRVPLDSQGRLWLEPVRLWLAGEGDHVVCFDEEGQKLAGLPQTTRALRQTAMRLDEQRTMTEDAILERRDALRKLEQEEKARKEAEQKADDLAARLADVEAEVRRLRGESPAS